MKELQFPLIKVTFLFVAGIIFSYWFHPTFWVIFSMLLVGFTTSIFLYVTSLNSLVPKFYFGIAILFTSFFVGSYALTCSYETRNPHHYINIMKFSSDLNSAEIIILEKLKNSSKNDRYIAEVYQLNQKNCTGKVLVNIKRNSHTPTIAIGSCVKVSGSFYKNRNPSNPNEFDYGKYLENKQVYAQIYADASATKISSIPQQTLGFYASKIRNKIHANLEKNNFGKSELSVVNALILGQQQDISKDIIQDYQYAGAVHILAVSGLHVGLILFFITLLLKPFPNTNRNRILKLILTIVLLCSYGILAGLSASITRSVVMFVFVAIGMFLRRSVNIYNTLMVSIMLILLVKPFFLFDVGFQLSYTAVFFIVWLQPLLSTIWTPENKYVKKYFWEPITVSFAAQIGTLPLCIYYFHQTSLLFFITNLIILPAIGFILGFGLVVMTLAYFSIIWQPMLKILAFCIGSLNKIVKTIASFQSFVLQDISITFYMMLSLFLILFTWVIWFKKPTFKKLCVGLFSVVLFQIFIFQNSYSNQKAHEFIVFTKTKNSIITARKGTKISIFSTDSLLKNIDDDLALKSYLIANFCTIDHKEPLSNLYYFKGKKILIIDSTAAYLKNKQPDILILRNSPRISLDRVFKFWKPEIVVADASNYKSYVEKWKATCSKEKIPFHATAEKGFYKL